MGRRPRPSVQERRLKGTSFILQRTHQTARGSRSSSGKKTGTKKSAAAALTSHPTSSEAVFVFSLARSQYYAGLGYLVIRRQLGATSRCFVAPTTHRLTTTCGCLFGYSLTRKKPT